MKPTQKLRKLLARHSIEIINTLLKNNIHFSLQCKTSSVRFNPALPSEITRDFHPIIDFILAGFTFESIEIFENEINFEAGFGKNDFSTSVSIPFSSIIQIYLPSPSAMLPQTCVFMNALNLLDLAKNDSDFLDIPIDLEDSLDENNERQNVSPIDDELIESSRKAILSNPNNKFD